ncbi:MAG: cbb3-type cytochrome c oxidase subunit I [Chitinophagaceae bacterium]|nr:cbb3-type cytochrome c oxidase subunit I [Chitinophagaceae bacterium]
MKSKAFFSVIILFAVAVWPGVLPAYAQEMKLSDFSFASESAWLWIVLLIVSVLFVVAMLLRRKVTELRKSYQNQKQEDDSDKLKEHIDRFNSQQIEKLLQYKKTKRSGVLFQVSWLLLAFTLFSVNTGWAQDASTTGESSLLGEGGIVITLVLVLIPILAGFILLMIKIGNAINQQKNKMRLEEASKLAGYLKDLPDEEIDAVLKKRKKALDYALTNHELSGTEPAEDSKGLLSITREPGLPIVSVKKKALPRPNIDPALARLVLGYLVCATCWLLFGTTVGQYVGIKFVAPDADHVSWLSFGRLRPVHTNAVFWGWASLAMIGLGYYIVPRVSNIKLYSMRMGWYALYLINASVLLGTISLMAGINNGGGEYREYIWPIMLLFGLGLALTLINFLRTIARRATTEIYISNWYMVSAIIFTIVISLAAYIPYWQNGLGETIIQGYYMHQGVGMWFMLFTLGIVYYFLPQQLNKPIYSYSLGILAFWTQILFYTLIGTHHFVFSAIPWWLQTVAIVGSAGMAIPVIAGTTNFLMTFKGAWYKVKDSYTLPFFLAGIIFYFTGSMQGTAEAFRFTNLAWHFTDFTVAHSHLTMYGIICFFLWACVYTIVPRLTGREAPQITMGAHFWLALIGLMFYSIPLMYGGTLKGLLWMQGKPFMEGVTLMAPYWLWRAIGGSLMWLSHLFFAYNMYKMIVRRNVVDVREAAIQKLQYEMEETPEPVV